MAKIKWMILILCALLTGECLAYKKIKCFVLHPPTKILPGVKRLAVLDGEGNGSHGRFLSDCMIQQLLLNSRGISAISGGLFSSSREGRTFLAGATTKVFDVVERGAIEAVLREQNLGMSGVIDASQAASVGKVLGVDAIVSVNYTMQTNDTRSTEVHEYYQNKQKYSKQVSCLTRKTSTTASMRIISVVTAQILGNLSKQYEEEDKGCEDGNKDLPSPDEQMQKMMLKASKDFVDYFNPQFVIIEIELEKIKVKEYERQAEEAAKAAEGNDIDQAYVGYYALYQQDSYNPQLLFNLGALNEVTGNYDEAVKMYEGALSLENSNDFRKAANRAERSAALAQAMSLIGITISKHTFEVSERAIAQVSAAKVVIKGRREDRIEVHESAELASPTIARIPGGISVKLIDTVNEWYKIELPDGKQGYVPGNQVDQ